MNKVLFMIINGEVRFNMDPNADHKEWYISLGFNAQMFDQIVRGFVLENRIIYYKGDTFRYDEEVIKAARMYTPYIRFTLQNPGLEAYCGISFANPSQWEPILKIQEQEIIGIKSTPTNKTNNNNQAVEAGPILEIKNDYEDETFVKTAIKVTVATLVITFIYKAILFSNKDLYIKNTSDVLLVISQIALLLITLYAHLKKKFYAKYTGIAASLLLVYTFKLVDVIIGILYFVFCVDQHYFINFSNFVKKIIKKNQKKE